MEVVFFHSFDLWISIRIFSFTTLEQVMGPQNKKFNEIKLFYIFFERNNYRKIHGLQVCLVLWSCVCFWELPRLKFERVESKGISSVCHGFASLNTNFVSLRYREHMGSRSPHARIANWGEHLQHRVFVQAPLLHHGFFFHSLFLRNTFTKIPCHLFL